MVSDHLSVWGAGPNCGAGCVIFVFCDKIDAHLSSAVVCALFDRTTLWVSEIRAAMGARNWGAGALSTYHTCPDRPQADTHVKLIHPPQASNLAGHELTPFGTFMEGNMSKSTHVPIDGLFLEVP